MGGGIAGITAAEELAGAGIDVHLVEREQSLGGYMARLSKTFPTEDCAMCSLAPQLTGAALEPRVHIRTLTDVTEISGPPGEFRVKLRQRPRFVSEACVGCDDCTPACPVSVSSEFELGVAKRKAISRPFANAVPSLYAIDKRGASPCKTACPAGNLGSGLRGARRRGTLRRGLPRRLGIRIPSPRSAVASARIPARALALAATLTSRLRSRR